jgi:hypothetical protein
LNGKSRNLLFVGGGAAVPELVGGDASVMKKIKIKNKS